MPLPLLRPQERFLLEVPLRFWDVFLLHAGEPLGYDLQPGDLDLPWLRKTKTFWEPVSRRQKNSGLLQHSSKLKNSLILGFRIGLSQDTAKRSGGRGGLSPPKSQALKKNPG